MKVLFLVLVGCTQYNLTPQPKVTPPVGNVPPIALTGPPQSTHINAPITLDGSGSYDPDGSGDGTLAFTWAVDGAPGGSSWQLSTGPTPTFSANVLGEYRVDLLVTDALNQDSTNPAATVVSVVPWQALEATLTWDAPVDLDLHLVAPGGTYFGDSDCYFANPSPDWGVPGDATDNPTLDQDDDHQGGPEDITLPQPQEGVYTFYVTYWNDRGEPTTTVTPELDLSAQGTMIAQVQGPPLTKEGDVWIAGTLDWSTLTFVQTNTTTTNTKLGGPTYNK